MIFNNIIYFKARYIPLISDDYACVIDLSHWGLLGHTFFRPLVVYYFDIFKPLFGMNPAGYHFCSIILHTFNSFILFLIIRLLLGEHGKKREGGDSVYMNHFMTAAALSLAFAASYSLSEAIFWIAAITTLFEAFFILMVIYTYSLYIIKRETRFLILSLLLFLLGLGAKEGVFILVGIIPLLYLSLHFRFPEKKIIFSWLYFWGIGLLYIAVASRIFSFAVKGGGYTFQVGWSLFRNIQQFVFSTIIWTPYNDLALVETQEKLLGIKTNAAINLSNPWFWIGVLCYLFLVLLIVKGSRESRVSWLMLLVACLPVSLPLQHLSGWYVFPYPLRTYYLPVLFFTLCLTIFLSSKSTFRSRRISLILSLLFFSIAVINGQRVFKRADDWIREGRDFKFIVEKIQKRVKNISTPKVLIRIVDDVKKRKGRRILMQRGINLNYNIAFSWIYNKKNKMDYAIRVQKFKQEESAYDFSDVVVKELKNGKLSLFIYSDKRVDQVTVDDLEI